MEEKVRALEARLVCAEKVCNPNLVEPPPRRAPTQVKPHLSEPPPRRTLKGYLGELYRGT